jgi:RecJ-like exonuclease
MGMSLKRISYFIVIVAAALTLVACERTKIGDITADPGRFMDKEVNVGGEVMQSIGFMGKGIYQIDDGTGKLWVLADRKGVPSKGARVAAKGRITPTVTFMGTNYATVMRESDRRSGE